MLIKHLCNKIKYTLFKQHIKKLKRRYLVDWRKSKVSKLCPNCGNYYNGYPALSRKDNKTERCPDCGTKEALEEFYKYQKQNNK